MRYENEIMDSYMKEDIPAFEYYYVGSTCNKPLDEFVPRMDGVKGQMVIVQSPKIDYVIWLGREISDIY